MSTPLVCPNCRATQRVESVGAGQSFSCPKCQHTWTPTPKAATPKKVRILDAEEMAAPSSADGEKARPKKKKPGEKLEPPKPLVLIGVLAGGCS